MKHNLAAHYPHVSVAELENGDYMQIVINHHFPAKTRFTTTVETGGVSNFGSNNRLNKMGLEKNQIFNGCHPNVSRNSDERLFC